MSYILPFLERLGLDGHAAVPDIRRAYARELKLIDQERDAAGFQLLREAYEETMQWTKWRADPVAPESTPAAAPDAMPPLAIFPDKVLSQVDPEALASAVFARFTANFARTVKGNADLAMCEAVLARALGDEALLNLSARMRFEGLVAQLLADGWKRGHEVLLVAASEVFEWGNDHRRLQEFGAAGAELSQAIDERNMFDAQPGDEVIAQRLVVARLRMVADPAPRDLLRDMHQLRALMTRFPTWLALVTSVDHINRWCELDSQMSGWRRMLAFAPKPKSGARWGFGGTGSYRLFTVVGAIMLINVINMMMRDGGSEPLPQAPLPELSREVVQVDARNLVLAEVLAELLKKREEEAAPAKSAAFLLEVKEVADSIEFVPAHFLSGRLSVTHTVELDAFGRLARLKVIQPSQASGFDEAVSASIRAHGHWGAESPRSFTLEHSR